MSIKQTDKIGEGAPGPGRPKGSPNKATATVRDAISRVADGMADDFVGWLRATAEGVSVPQTEEEIAAGQPKKYLVKPNPEGAAKVYLAAIEYHIPKLSRTELTGKDGAELIPPQFIIQPTAPRGE